MSILKIRLPVDLTGLLLSSRLQRRNPVLASSRHTSEGHLRCILCGSFSSGDKTVERRNRHRGLEDSLTLSFAKADRGRDIHSNSVTTCQLVALKCAADVNMDVAKRDPKDPTPTSSVLLKTEPNTSSGQSQSKKTQKSGSSRTVKTLKMDEREKSAKIKLDDLLKAGKETSLNQMLLAYLELCTFTGQPTKALHTLNFYRGRGENFPAVSSVMAFNIILKSYSAKGNTMKVKEILQLMTNERLQPDCQTYAAVLESLGRNSATTNNLKSIQDTLNSITSDGFQLNDLFNRTVFTTNQHEMVLTAIRRKIPSFYPAIKQPYVDYMCPLLLHLNARSGGNAFVSSSEQIFSPAQGVISENKLQEMAIKQLNIELHGYITVKSIEKVDEAKSSSHYRKILEDTEANWTKAIEEAFERNMYSISNRNLAHKNQRLINIQPFLKFLTPEDCTSIIKRQIQKLAEGSETYSQTINSLYREIGEQVLSRYDISYKKEMGILGHVGKLYHDYIKWYLNPTPGQVLNSRQKWQELLYDPKSTGPTMDIGERCWPNSLLCSIGRFLYEIIMRDIKINANVMKVRPGEEQMVPAFYSIFRVEGYHMKEEIKPHPALVKLFQMGNRNELTFESTMVPMVCPPLPWASIRTGGYLLSAAKIIRLPYQAHQQKCRLEQCQPEDLYPSLDSLNQLGNVPWRINERVLDIIIEVFNNKGDESLAIPPPPSECPTAPHIEPTMDKEEKVKLYRLRQALKRKKAEMFSLHCDAVYKFSVANHFRKEVFWFPQNMDFRGRVYPCPPHLNHLGSDPARSILIFARGEPLGPRGLDWLKIHCINLTGLKKREPLKERLKYADLILDKILDSADNPLGGQRWWAESEEPWQTLACCIEIADASRSGDPEAYISHFPVHQDGSCNGLQHYAALGRDQAGAESVNLVPCDSPQDVYNAVAKLVEKLRIRDASNGITVAQHLEGFINRKVIKQTVMTTVYGVTRFGARIQIAKQLKDIPDFPKEHLWPASIYLVSRTFDSLQEMFTSTKEIQDWFTECARLISQVCGQNVEWITPMGLPIVQPYFKTAKENTDSHDPLKLKEVYSMDMFERPNVMKQKNAFPPNYIHSLDSSHMMLTSLHCERAKITFAAVHDCYWTHPMTVETMNKICREQFVVLHSQPLLEDLSKFLVQKYSYADSDLSSEGFLIELAKNELNRTLRAVPVKGTFDLKSVLKSIYFFS